MFDFFAMLDYIWNISAAYSKYVLLTLIIQTFYKTRKIDGISFLQKAFVVELFSHGEFIVLGFVLGGIIGIITNNFIIASIVAILLVAFSFYKPKKQKEMSQIHPFKQKILNLFLILGFLVMIISIFTNNLSLNSFATLFLYGMLFWRV